MYRSFTDEAFFLVKRDGAGVFARDYRDERGDAVFRGFLFDVGKQDAADVLVQVFVTHVYRKICGAAVGAARVEGVEIGISHDLARIVARHDIGICAAYPCHTCGEFLATHLFLFKRKTGVPYVIIIDIAARADVGGAYFFGPHGSVYLHYPFVFKQLDEKSADDRAVLEVVVHRRYGVVPVCHGYAVGSEVIGEPQRLDVSFKCPAVV